MKSVLSKEDVRKKLANDTASKKESAICSFKEYFIDVVNYAMVECEKNNKAYTVIDTDYMPGRELICTHEVVDIVTEVVGDEIKFICDGDSVIINYTNESDTNGLVYYLIKIQAVCCLLMCILYVLLMNIDISLKMMALIITLCINIVSCYYPIKYYVLNKRMLDR